MTDDVRPPTLTCREAARRLWGFLDHALPPDETRAVAEHLAGCPECESHRRHAAAFRRAVRDAGRGLAAPAPLVARVRAAVLAAGGSAA